MIFDEFLTSCKESLILCAFTVLTDNVKLSEVIKKYVNIRSYAFKLVSVITPITKQVTKNI